MTLNACYTTIELVAKPEKGLMGIMGYVEIISPRPPHTAESVKPVPLRYLDTLRGKTVVILEQRKPRFPEVYGRIKVLLKEEQGVIDVLEVPIPITYPAPKSLLDEVAQKVDAAIVGFGQ